MAVIDSVEVRVSTWRRSNWSASIWPRGTAVFFEIAPEQAEELLPIAAPRWRFRKAAHRRSSRQMRFLRWRQIAGFMARCAELGVPFKATAGLHHPLRCVRSAHL